MKTMGSNKNVFVQRVYNTAVIGTLANKYGYSQVYVRRCVRGDADGVMPDQIRKEYKELDKKMNELLNSQ